MSKTASEGREKIGSREPNLSSSGLTGEAAKKCCERRKNSFELEVRQALGELSNALTAEADASRPGLALVPPGVVIPGLIEAPSLNPRVIQVPARTSPGGIAAFGAVLLFAGAGLLDGARRLGALEASNAALGILDSVGTRQKRKLDDCESCIRRYLWSQKKPLVRVAKTTKRQRTDDPKLKRKPGRPKGSKDKRKRKVRRPNPRSLENLRKPNPRPKPARSRASPRARARARTPARSRGRA